MPAWLKRLGVAGFLFLLSGIIRFILDKVAIYSLLLGLLLLVFGMVFFGFGIVTAQNRFIMEELWLSQIQKRKDREHRDSADRRDRRPQSGWAENERQKDRPRQSSQRTARREKPDYFEPCRRRVRGR